MSCGCKNKGVNGHLCCHQVETLGLVATDNRTIKDGSQYDELFPAANLKDTIVNPNGTVKYTVEQMEKVVQDNHWQVAKIAKKLEGKDVSETLKNVWDFGFNFFKYKLDKDGTEELRTPARSWHDGQILARNPATFKKAGIDCDCYSILVASILTELGIKYKLRVTKYSAGWQHVYVVIPTPNKPHLNWIVDCVLDKFNIEKTYSDKFDYTMNGLKGLGIPVAILSGSDADELHSIISGADFDISGFGATEDPHEILGAIKKHLVRTKNFIERNPGHAVYQGGAKNNVKMLNHVIKNWDNHATRDKALMEAAKVEHEQNVAVAKAEHEEDVVSGLAAPGDFSYPETFDHSLSFSGTDDETIGGLDDLGNDDDFGDVNVLGKAKKSNGKREPKKFFKNVRKVAGKVGAKIKAGAKKVGGALKKVGKAIVRFNPITLAARGGYLLVLRENWWGMAHGLYPAFLSKEAALSKGYSASDWEKAQKAKPKVIKIFVKTLQGKEANLIKILEKGWNRKPKVGFLQGLGIEPASTTVAVAASAAPVAATGSAMTAAGITATGGGTFIAAIKKFFSKHKDKIKDAAGSDASKGFFAKLKEKHAAKKAAKIAAKQNEDGSTENTDGSVTNTDGSVTNPDGTIEHENGQVTTSDGSDITAETAATYEDETPEEGGDGGTTEEAPTDETPSDETPAENNPEDEGPTDGLGFLDKAKAFVKEKPLVSTLIGVGIVGTTLMLIPATRKPIVAFFTGKKKPSLSGAKKRRKKPAKRAHKPVPKSAKRKSKVRFVKM